MHAHPLNSSHTSYQNGRAGIHIMTENGYQPTKGKLDKSKPPQQGSGVPRSPPLSKTTFNTEGIEVIRRTVKKIGSGAHATLPKEWLDETVIVIRTGE